MMAMSSGSGKFRKNASLVQSFESRTRRRMEHAAAGRLSELERAELAYLWGGYESALGCKSLHGAIESRLLRSPPNDVRRIVLDELQRLGGHAPREKMVAVLVADRSASAYEARRAIGSLVGSGDVDADVRHNLRSRMANDGTVTRELEAEAMIHLAAKGACRRAEPATRQERWAREDEELEALCLGGPICADQGGGAAIDREDDAMTRKPTRALFAIQALSPLHRRVLERLYGSGPAASYIGMLGREYAAVAHLTTVAEAARMEMAAARGRYERRSLVGAQAEESMRHDRREEERMRARREAAERQTQTAEAMHLLLDAHPDGELSRKRWLENRETFLATIRRQAEALIVAACAAYRLELGKIHV